METVFIITAKIIAVIIDVVSFAMIARMLLPLFGDAEDSKIGMFVALITEPFIIPIRFLLFKFNLLQDSPIDWSFTISYMVLIFVRMFLPII